MDEGGESTEDLRAEIEQLRVKVRDLERHIGRKERRTRDKDSEIRKPRSRTRKIEGEIQSDFGDLGDLIMGYLGSVLSSLAYGLEGALESAGGTRRDSRSPGRKLIEMGVSIRPEDRERFFDEGSLLISALGEENRLLILKLLERGGLSTEEIVEEAVKVKPDFRDGSLKHHLDRLEEVGLATKRSDEDSIQITPFGREALALSEILAIRTFPEALRSSNREMSNFTEEEE